MVHMKCTFWRSLRTPFCGSKFTDFHNGTCFIFRSSYPKHNLFSCIEQKRPQANVPISMSMNFGCGGTSTMTLVVLTGPRYFQPRVRQNKLKRLTKPLKPFPHKECGEIYISKRLVVILFNRPSCIVQCYVNLHIIGIYNETK